MSEPRLATPEQSRSQFAKVDCRTNVGLDTLSESTDHSTPRKMSLQEQRPPSAERKRRLWTWLGWIYLVSLVAARVLWATTAYYEWIPLGVAGAIAGFAYLTRPRELKDRTETHGDNVSEEP